MKTVPTSSRPTSLGAWLQAQQQDSQVPAYDLQLLACDQLGLSRAQLLAHPELELSLEQHQALDPLAQRLQAGEPLAYLLGTQEFWSLEFKVSPAVLIPRPETELLVEIALAKALDRLAQHQVPSIVELGTGSGAISIALATELAQKLPPQGEMPTIIATDISADALEIAQSNAKRLEAPILLAQASWLDAFGPGIDLLVSNPPYIAAEDPHLPALAFEPSRALVAGPAGLDDLQQICHQATTGLNPGGWLLLEHGYQQGPAVTQLLANLGFCNLATEADLAGLDRVTLGQWPNSTTPK